MEKNLTSQANGGVAPDINLKIGGIRVKHILRPPKTSPNSIPDNSATLRVTGAKTKVAQQNKGPPCSVFFTNLTFIVGRTDLGAVTDVFKSILKIFLQIQVIKSACRHL